MGTGWAAELDAFGPLLGHWEGPGTFFGKAATARYHWERGLDGKFVILRYQALRDGQTLFAGHGYYRANGTGAWHDSHGNLYAIAWKATTGGVDSAWGPGTGTSEYRVNAGGEFTAIDQAQAKTFATFRLRRQSGASVGASLPSGRELADVAAQQGIDSVLHPASEDLAADEQRGRRTSKEQLATHAESSGCPLRIFRNPQCHRPVPCLL